MQKKTEYNHFDSIYQKYANKCKEFCYDYIGCIEMAINLQLIMHYPWISIFYAELLNFIKYSNQS